MNDPTLLAYATKHGSTREVAESVAASLRKLGVHVEVVPAAQVDDLSGYDAVVLGGPLYVGRWHPESTGFLKRHRRALSTMPLAVFALGPRSLTYRDAADSRAQLERALAKVPEVAPAATAIFGGVLDPGKLRFPFNRIAPVDARDWDAIRAWAESLPAVLAFGKPAEDPGDPRRTLQQTPR